MFKAMPKNYKFSAISLISLLLLFFSSTTIAADEINGADTAWIMISTALVLFMTLPGLALLLFPSQKIFLQA